MKKNFVCTALLLAVLLFMCSCLTFSKAPLKYTEEEAKEAMTVLMNKTVENANTRFFQKLSSYSFIPEGYSKLISYQEQIPGMKAIIKDWNKNMSSFLDENKDTIINATTKTIKEVQYKNASELVKESGTSGSEYVEKLYKKQFVELINELVTKANFDKLKSGVNHYNAWIENQNHKNSTNMQKLEEIDVAKQVSELIYNYYFDSIRLYEEFFRTTPDPFAEEIFTKVFGVE